jgi:hypothetical protein
MRNNFPDVQDDKVENNIILTGAIVCACCGDIHNSWKDIIREQIENETNIRIVNTIGSFSLVTYLSIYVR